MKPPTSGTQVFSAELRTGTSAAQTRSSFGAPVDLVITNARTPTHYPYFWDRLRGRGINLDSTSTAAEIANGTTDGVQFGEVQNGFTIYGSSGAYNVSGGSFVDWCFRRFPQVFDVVCYTGTGSARTVAHNLGVAPELMIVKRRNEVRDWGVYHAALGATKYLFLNLTDAAGTHVEFWNNTVPTASVFTVGTGGAVNTSTNTYIAYLFATKAGISKVGSYVGTGVDGQVVDCGFAAGARFVMIKRAEGGSWFVADTVRGIVAGFDAVLYLNTTGAESTNADHIDPHASGFSLPVSSVTNVAGGNFIYLAIA
jgi:hypothetical protein